MHAEASAVLRAVVADFFFSCWCLEIRRDFGKYQGASTIKRKGCD
jgi:hypothetical protein